MFNYGGAPTANGESARLRGRIGGTGSVEGISYPNPFFDLAHTYLPNTVKQMFQWCRFYYLTNALIATVVNKMAEYPITDLVIDTDSVGLKSRWENYFERDIYLRAAMVDIGLFYMVYGNAIVSLSHPFIKWLKCAKCKTEVQATKAKYTFRSCKFYLSCATCGHDGDAEVRDQFLKTPHNTRLLLWNPEDIDIRYNELTAETTYYYTLPGHVKNAIMIGKRGIVDRSPQVFIDAVKQQKAVVLDPDNVYHLRRPSILTGKLNRGWGTPLLMSVLKDTFYLQLMKKSQEAVLLERMLPLNVFSPGMSAPGANPYELVNLKDWREHVMSEIVKWRRDPLYMPVMPIPLQHQVIGGDGRALLLTAEMRQIAETIIAGMGCPPELVFGGLSWCIDPATFVFTDNGLERAGDLCPAAGSSTLRRRFVTAEGVSDQVVAHTLGKKPVARISVQGGFDCTSSHQHRYRRLEPDLSMTWARADELRPGDKIALRLGANLWPDDAPSTAAAVGAADVTDKRDTSKGYPVMLPNELTPELARMLGYLVAEGSCAGHRERIGFTQQNVGVMNDFLRCVESVFGYRPSTGRNDSTNRYGSGVITAEIGRGRAVRFLRALGLDQYSADKSVPRIVRSAPRHLVAEFLRGFFEGDGGITDQEEKQSVFGVSVSEQLLKQIQLLLQNMGILSFRYPPAEDGGTWQLQIRSEFVDRYLDLVGFVSNRKKTVAQQRTSTGLTHLAERIPYLKENLDAVRHRHFQGRSSWRKDHAEDLVLQQEEYTTRELADLLERDSSLILWQVRKGRLRVTGKRVGEKGHFGSYTFSRGEVCRFLRETGLGVRRTIPGRAACGMTYSNMVGRDLSDLYELEPDLAQRVSEVLRTRYVWLDVQYVDLLDIEERMVDFTVAGDHSYIADGLVVHNSGSNVSLRMLENTFLRYMSGLLRLIRYFIVRRTAAHLDWPEVDVRFKPFKMADDLQRKAFLFQLNQAKLISDTTMLQDSDFNPEEENDLLHKEVKRRLTGVEEQQLAEASIAGKAQVEQAKWQTKAQMVMAREQEQMQAGKHGTAPGEPGEGTSEMGVSPPPASEPTGQFQQMVERIRTLSPEAQQQVLQRIGAQNAELAGQIYQQLNPQPQGGGGSAGKPLPEQKPPRREAALI